MANKEYNVVISAKETGFKEVDRRIDGISAKLKTIGKISDFTLAKKASDVAEGIDLGGFVGRGGAVLGGAAIAGTIGRAMQAGSGQIDAASEAARAGKSVSAIASEGVRALPLLGDAVKGIDSFRDSLGNIADAINEQVPLLRKIDEFFGFEIKAPVIPIDQLLAEAQKAEAKVAAIYARRAKVREFVAERPQATPEGSARGEMESNLRFLDAMRKKSELSQEEYERARRVAVRRGEDQITDIRKQASARNIAIARAEKEETLSIYRDLERSRRDFSVSIREAAGDRTGADIERIRNEAKSAIEDIQRQIEAVKSDPKISDAVRGERVKALETKREEVIVVTTIEEKIIRGKAEESNAKRIADIRRQAVENEVAAGNEAAAIDLRRLEIAEKYRQQIETIAELEKDSTLSAEQRDELRLRRQQIESTRSRETAREVEAAMKEEREATRRRVVDTARTIIGRGTTPTTDSRWQSSAVAQRKQVETFRDDQQSAKTTAKNTAAMAKGIDTLVQTMKTLNTRLQVVRLT